MLRHRSTEQHLADLADERVAQTRRLAHALDIEHQATADFTAAVEIGDERMARDAVKLARAAQADEESARDCLDSNMAEVNRLLDGMIVKPRPPCE